MLQVILIFFFVDKCQLSAYYPDMPEHICILTYMDNIQSLPENNKLLDNYKPIHINSLMTDQLYTYLNMSRT